MHILFINRYFYPDHAPTGVLLSDLAFALSRQGAKVTVVTSRLRYDGSQPLTAYETANGIEIHRIWTFKGSGGLVGRSLGYGSFYTAGAWRLWRLARGADIIVAKTDPPLLSVLVAVIAKLRGPVVVNWLQDVFPEVAEHLNIGGRLGGPIFRLMRPLRNWSLRKATMNVVIGQVMAEYLRQQGISPERIRVISNWSDGAHIKRVSGINNELRKEWGLIDKFVVVYAGNLGRAHELDTIVEAVALLQERALSCHLARQIVFVFIGGGTQHAKLEQEISRRKLHNVQVQPYQPQDRLAETLGLADVHLVSLNPSLEGLIVPSKFYGICAAGRPTLFIGSPDGEIARLLTQNGCGFTIAPGDKNALANRILQLQKNPELCASLGENAREAFEVHWDKRRALECWEEVFTVINKRGDELTG